MRCIQNHFLLFLFLLSLRHLHLPLLLLLPRLLLLLHLLRLLLLLLPQLLLLLPMGRRLLLPLLFRLLLQHLWQCCLNECRLCRRQPRWQLQLLLPSSRASQHCSDGCGICQHAPHPHCRRRLAASLCRPCCLATASSWLCGATAGS